MPSPATSPIPTWLLLVLMAVGAKRQRVDRRGSEAAGDGDECKGRDGEGCPFSTADHQQRRESNGVGNGLKRYCNRCSENKLPRHEPVRQHVDTAASTSEQQLQQPRDMNAVLGARGYASSNKQIGAGRPVTGRVWNGNAGRALPIDPSDQTLIDHDQRSDGGRRRRYNSNIPALWTDPNGPYPWLLVRKDPHLLVDGHCKSDEPNQPPCTACTNCARMYGDLCANRTANAYCPNRGCRKFTKQSPDEHAARYHKPREVGSQDVRQQLTEEQLRIRTRLLCILLTVVFLARQHIALRKLPFVAKLVHSLLVAENAECQEIQFTARPLGLRRNWGEAGREGGEGERERERLGKKREMRPTSSPLFGRNPGAIVHFSTSSLTWPPKRIAARAASQRLPRPEASIGQILSICS